MIDIEPKPNDVSKPNFNPQKPNNTESAEEPTTPSTAQIQIQDVHRIWHKFLQEFEDSKSLLFILKPCRVIGVEGDCVLLELEFAYHKKNIENARNKQLIENALRKHLNANNVTIKGIINEQNQENGIKTVKDTANSIIDAFGGEIIN